MVHQVYARLRDVETGLAGVERHVDSLMDIGHAPDTLRYGRRGGGGGGDSSILKNLNSIDCWIGDGGEIRYM